MAQVEYMAVTLTEPAAINVSVLGTDASCNGASDGSIDLTDAGGSFISALPGAYAFDSAMSFALIRGGHLDMTVLGGLEVDAQGRLANWLVPGRMVAGMGGAMDLVAGVGRVIVVMDHTNKHGESKVLKECTLPLTGKAVVDLIITNLGVLEVGHKGLHIVECAPGISHDDIRAATEAKIV